MESSPSIVVVSCSSTKPKSLIKLITKKAGTETESGLIYQPWTIDTKYYTANVNFVGLDKTFNRTEDFNSRVEAIILHMDSNKESGLEELNNWEDLENDCDPEIKLLVSNYATEETKITKSQAVDWCLKRGFEFVELYPNNTGKTEDDIIEEKFGVNRIIEALQSHTWSNLVMKPKEKVKKPDKDGSKESGDSSSGTNGEGEFSSDVDDFTELFSQLHMMKESLHSMPINQRKQCAEQMVTAFWKAIGGEEEELLDV